MKNKTGKKKVKIGKMSDIQYRALKFCFEYLQEEDQLPTTRQMQIAFGFESQTSGRHLLDSLVRDGYLEKNSNGKLRFTR